jgi:hypothetical protein
MKHGLLDKQIVIRLVEKFSAFDGTPLFITVFTGVHH